MTYKLLVELADFDGYKKYALYNSFTVSNESTKYTLSISGYEGTAGKYYAIHVYVTLTTV